MNRLSSYAVDFDEPFGGMQFGPEGELEPPRPPRRRGRRLLAVVLLTGLLALFAAAALFAYAYVNDGAPGGEKVTITIPEGADAATIASLLADKRIVDNERVFSLRLRVSGRGAEFKSGTYTMATSSSFDQIARALEEGPPPPPTFDITIPEGFRNTDTAKLIDSLRRQSDDGEPTLPAFSGKEYLDELARRSVPAGYPVPMESRRDPATKMEGFLFPATYQLLHVADAGDLVDRQLAAFTEVMNGLDVTRAKAANLTKYDLVIIASMIEREAQLDSERPLVAAVLYNRLKLGMTLGIDATIQYGLGEWKTQLTMSDLAGDNPYNSRLHAGLPPTPIANPGKASLEAAAAPADVDHLYYVAHPDGSGKHFFTDSYDEFLNFQQ